MIICYATRLLSGMNTHTIQHDYYKTHRAARVRPHARLGHLPEERQRLLQGAIKLIPNNRI